MTIAELIDELENLTVGSSEDYAALDRLNELATLVQQHHEGHLASEALLGVLERHPQVEFGTPGQLVHTIEAYSGHYEKWLLASLARRPTATTVWMLNRLINAAPEAQKTQLLNKLNSLRTHPVADELARAAAEDFYTFQTAGE